MAADAAKKMEALKQASAPYLKRTSTLSQALDQRARRSGRPLSEDELARVAGALTDDLAEDELIGLAVACLLADLAKGDLSREADRILQDLSA